MPPVTHVTHHVDGAHLLAADARLAAGDGPGADRFVRRAAKTLTRVPEIRHHRGDTNGAGTPARVAEHHQLDQRLVDLWAGRLDDEQVRAPLRASEHDVELTVREPFEETVFGGVSSARAIAVSNIGLPVPPISLGVIARGWLGRSR